MSVFTVKLGCERAGPVPRVGCTDRPTPPHTITPGTTTPCTTRPATLAPLQHALRGPDSVHQASFGYSLGPKILDCSKPPLFLVKKGPVKTAHFGKKAYPILIGFPENAIFDVFTEKQWILHFSRDTTGLRRFSLFSSCQVFPLKVVKIPKFHEI